MDSRLPGGADALRLPLAVQARSVDEPLRRVLGRGRDVEPATLLVDAVDVDDIVIPRRQEPDRPAVPRNRIGVPPAVALAQPEEVPAAAEPDEIGHDLDPRFVPVREDGPDLARGRVADPDRVGVLQPVELLKDDLPRIPGPLEPRDVGVARVPGRFHPDRSAARDRDDADADIRVRLAGHGVLEADELRVERVRVVDHGEDRDAARVEVPEGDGPAVRAPAETVADVKLLLVDPVGGAVDRLLAAVEGQLADAAGREVLGIDIVVNDIRGSRAVRGELGEHQRRGFEVHSELVEPARTEVVGPEITTRVLPPDALGVGEDDEDFPVGGPIVILDGQGFCGARRDELGRRHQDLARARPGPVEDEVATLLGRGARLEGRIGLAVPHPAGRAEPLGGELAGTEDPVDGQDRVGRLVLGRRERRERRGRRPGWRWRSGTRVCLITVGLLLLLGGTAPPRRGCPRNSVSACTSAPSPSGTR